jgi:hypothetical protein
MMLGTVPFGGDITALTQHFKTFLESYRGKADPALVGSRNACIFEELANGQSSDDNWQILLHTHRV